jgi:ATP-binding protein involved in chromosome partitioning
MSDPVIPDRGAVLAALDRVLDPRSGQGLASAGLVNGLVLRAGRAAFMLEVPAADVAAYEPVREAAERALATVEGVATAQVVLTSEGPAQAPARTVSRKTARMSEDPQARLAPPAEAEPLANVRRVIAIASGKGGVGKSTVATNLAVALAKQGLAVGLLDADVYGPSAPQMMGVDGDPAFGEDKKIHPLEAWGVQVMSIGFLVGEGAPMILRGPMASSAVRQMSHGVAWGREDRPLDVLVVDLPPGTGDIHLTLIQRLRIDGVVIVSTPQEIALIDARRAAGMFAKTGTKVLGVVENMAYFADPASGARIPIFGTGGAAKEAERLEAPLLAEVPIEIAVREGGDTGQPVVIGAPDSAAAKAFVEMARRLSA